MKTNQLLIGVGIVVAVAAGVFGGQAGWTAYEQHKAAAAAEAASAAAAAEALTMRGQQRTFVAKEMSVPNSAIFRNDFPSPKQPDFWCGEVSGKNLMGVQLEFVRYTAQLKLAGGKVFWADVDFEERDPRGESSIAQARRVAYQWNVFCNRTPEAAAPLKQ